jgi:hypothetical protein
MANADVDRALATVLRRQHGVVSRRQALAAGLTDQGLIAARRTGRFVRLAAGVYADAGHPATWQRQLMAAVLAHRGQAVVTGRAAAALWGFDGFRPVRPQLLVPHSASAVNALARVTRTRHFDRSDLTRLAGLPVVNTVRLAVELAGELDAKQLGRLVDEGVLRGKLDLDRLLGRTAVLLRGRRSGRDTMCAVLEDRLDGYVPATSELERLLFATLDAAGYREYVPQFKLPWERAGRPAGTVDALFPLDRAIIEGDGRLWHARLEAWERDRQRDLDVLAHGFVPIRVTWRALTKDTAPFLQALGQWLTPSLPRDRAS